MKFQDRYQFDFGKDLLGTGGFASVYKAKDVLLDRDVAIKIFNQQSGNKYSVVDEIKKVIKFDHPSLLRYYDVVLLDQQNILGQKEQLQIGVMEYANAGDLKDFVKDHPNSPLLFKFLQQILKGLEYLHQKNIIHRDLKPQNILLVEENGQINAKLSDFGISKDMESEAKSSTMAVGTIEYMAPEQFSPQKYGIDGKIGSNVDLWSFGIMVYELIAQTTPFGSRDGNTTAEQIMSSILSTEQPKDFDKLPEPYRTVVKKCLVANAKERIRKASELIQYFDSNFTQSNTTQSDNSTKDEQATKVYGKQAQSKTANDDDATKVYSKEKEQAKQLQSIPWWKRKGILATLTTAIIITVSGAYFKTEYDKKVEQAAKETDESIIEFREALSKNDHQLASRLIEMFKNSDNTKAWIVLGDAYLYGIGSNRDYKKSMEWYMKAAQQNNSSAQNNIGYMYFEGVGVTKDYSKAMVWFLKAADQNNSAAHNNIGCMYHDGSGVVKSYEKAVEWYKKAAYLEQNNAHQSQGIDCQKNSLGNAF